jgi:hypothetical protein
MGSTTQGTHMSRFSLEYCTDRDLPEWLVVKEEYTARQVTVGSVVFKSFSQEEAQTILEEYMIQEQAAEIDYFRNQECEFDNA